MQHYMTKREKLAYLQSLYFRALHIGGVLMGVLIIVALVKYIRT